MFYDSQQYTFVKIEFSSILRYLVDLGEKCKHLYI